MSSWPDHQWRVRVDGPATGAENMARDRQLRDELLMGRRPPTLRFYSWKPACISLGRGQRPELLREDDVRRAGLDVVQRPTGGQALLHDDEMTYCVVASQQDRFVGGALLDSYRSISTALLSGLTALGVDATGAPALPRPAKGLTPICFASASAEEVLVDGRKLLASAQWRGRGIFLQHGSLLLTDRQAEIASFMRDPTEAPPSSIAVSLSELMAEVPSRERLVELLSEGFEQALGVELVPERSLDA